MFTVSEREEFALQGVVKRANFLPATKLNAAREVIFQYLAQAGVWRNNQWHMPDAATQTETATGNLSLKSLDRHQTMIELTSDELPAAASALVNDVPVTPMTRQPGLLFTLPNAATWTVPHKNWHLDVPRLPEHGVPGVQIFTFLETVAHGGGGTLVVAGSHRLLNEGVRINSADLRKRLLHEAYFADLMQNPTGDRSRFLREVGYVGDVALKVIELTGQPGDVYFMDFRILHTVAPNALNVPRIMLTQRYLVEAARMAFSGS